MFCRSPEAIDITAALARWAMSAMEDPDDFASDDLASPDLISADLASACFGAGTFIAIWAGAEAFVFGASASLEVAAAFGATTGGEASATLVASTGLGGSPCGEAAANLSLNMSEAETFSGAEINGERSGSEAKISLKLGRAGRAATTVELATGGASNAELPTVG
jgi:hypothetical protein